MYKVLLLIILPLFVLGIVIFFLNRNKFRFFIEGLDAKISLKELFILWKAVSICRMENPEALFCSAQSLAQCISNIKIEAENAENSQKLQDLLSQLYEFRGRLEKEADKKRGLESTRILSSGQKLIILMKGKGLFESEIINSARYLTIFLPVQKNKIVISGKDWIGKPISVYLWRKGDAGYIFDTSAAGTGAFLGKPVLYLEHTTKLLRSQKRNSPRAKCSISGDIYILKEETTDFSSIETRPGYKCVVEDISENGALIRAGGKGYPDVHIRLQFKLESKLIVMFGIIRSAEYNSETNQSLLHFECFHIDPPMKNEILCYVYSTMSEIEKHIYEEEKNCSEEESASAADNNSAKNMSLQK